MKKTLFVVLAVIGFSFLAPINSSAIDSDKAQGKTQTQTQTQTQGQDKKESQNKDGDRCVSTAILGQGNQVCDDGNGSSIIDILKLVVNIMSIGVGVLGVVGITIVGIQYLTAGGNEEKTRTAKRRILEIVIGLAAYAAAYAILQWLLPSFDGI